MKIVDSNRYWESLIFQDENMLFINSKIHEFWTNLAIKKFGY